MLAKQQISLVAMKRNQSICVTTNILNESMQHSPGIILSKKISTDSLFGQDILIQETFSQSFLVQGTN